MAAAGQHGAYGVAIELHLDYTGLKRRVSLAGSKAASTELVAPRFVELFAPSAAAGQARPYSQCVVELDNARGAKMRVELSGSPVEALTVLCASFWGA